MKNKKILLIILIIILIFGATSFLAINYYFRNMNHDNIQEPISSGDLKKIPEETEEIHALVVGVDYTEEMTDTIIYVSYNPTNSSVKMLSIPRDTFIGDEIVTGKINHVYKSAGNDIEALVHEVEERFLLPVDYYAMFTLEMLGNVVDDMGGVEITIDQPIYDNSPEHNKYFDAGTQVLNGNEAQLFVCNRYSYVDADLGRINAQQKFLVALMHKVQSLGKFEMLQLVTRYFDEVKTDMPLNKIMSVAVTAFAVKEEDIESFTVPGVGKMNRSYAVYEVDKEALAQLLSEHFLPEEIEAEDLDFPIVVEPIEPVQSQDEVSSQEEQIEEEETEQENSDGRYIYPDPHDYDPWIHGDFDTWYRENTVRVTQENNKKNKTENETDLEEGKDSNSEEESSSDTMDQKESSSEEQTEEDTMKKETTEKAEE